MADDNILSMAQPADEPNQDVVEMLEWWLKRARGGEIRAIAMAGITSDHGVTTSYEMGYAPQSWTGLIGGLESCKHRLLMVDYGAD